MKLEQRCTVPVARDELWRFLMDVPAMASCVPGVETVAPRGDNRYEGRLKVRVGPIGLTLDGAMIVREQDEAAYQAAVDADANDRRVGGGVRVNARMALRELAAGETELVVTADARLLGKLGEFGQPVIRKKAEAMMAEFARNVTARFQA